jgi:hypothetical protein
MRRAAILEQEDDGLGAGLGAFLFGFGLEDLRKREPKQAKPADFKHVPASELGDVETGAATHKLFSFLQ